MRSSYRVGMHISGCLSSGNRVDHQTFEKIVQSVVSPLLGLQEFSALTQDVAKTKTRFLRYLCAGSPRDGRHPLNHLVLAVALFGSWERFWEVYQSQNESSGEIASTAGLEPIARAPTTAATDQRKAQFLLLLDPGNQSVSAVAAQVGIAVGTAMAWAAAHGLENQRRPKTLKADRRIALIADLKRGSDKLVAANNAGVSVQTVTRLLFTESGLHDAWQQRRFTQAQSAARKLWKSTIEDFPENSSVGWRKLQPASYAWLYRNDRT